MQIHFLICSKELAKKLSFSVGNLIFHARTNSITDNIKMRCFHSLKDKIIITCFHPGWKRTWNFMLYLAQDMENKFTNKNVMPLLIKDIYCLRLWRGALFFNHFFHISHHNICILKITHRYTLSQKFKWSRKTSRMKIPTSRQRKGPLRADTIL